MENKKYEPIKDSNGNLKYIKKLYKVGGGYINTAKNGNLHSSANINIKVKQFLNNYKDDKNPYDYNTFIEVSSLNPDYVDENKKNDGLLTEEELSSEVNENIPF